MKLTADLEKILKKKLLSLGASTRDAFLVAVSGGADSTALLLIMKKVVGREGTLTAAHLDHGIRPGSREERRKVEQLCRRLGVGTIVDRIDPEELKARRLRCGSLEAAMRELRYTFLARALEQSGSQWILTGHTEDDQAETVFFRAIRAMDWRSLGGIPARRGSFLRPLIEVPRASTLLYCRAMEIDPVVDPSNYDEAYARSRIRNRILPGLAARFHPDVSALMRRLGRAATRLSLVEEKLLGTFVPGYTGHGECAADPGLMQRLPALLTERVVVDYLFHVTGSYPSRNLAGNVRDFIMSGRNGVLSLPGNRVLTLSYGCLGCEEAESSRKGILPLEARELTVPGSLTLPGAGIRVTAVPCRWEGGEDFPSGKVALISRKAAPGSLLVRKRLSGDRFTPLGMTRGKKLKDFLLDRKVPRKDRDRVPIVLNSEGEILWVGGIEISRKAALEGMKGEEGILVRIEELPSGDPAGPDGGPRGGEGPGVVQKMPAPLRETVSMA